VVPIDDVVEKKFATVDALVSQIYEGGCDGSAALVPDPKDAAAVAARKKTVREEWSREFSIAAEKFRAKLKDQMGEQKASAVRYAEAFEICEYGRQPTKAELQRLFPFLTLSA
jgi:hypothetical protein